MIWPAKRIVHLGAVLALVASGGCGGAESPRRLPGGYRLVQKDQYQALYAPDGRIARLLYDSNRDGRAEGVVLYRRNGKPERGELDTDEDGTIDRWEHFRTDGTLDRVDVDADRDGQVDRPDDPR